MHKLSLTYVKRKQDSFTSPPSSDPSEENKIGLLKTFFNESSSSTSSLLC